MKRILIVTAWAISLMFFSTAGLGQEAASAQSQSGPPPATITGSGTTSYIPLWTGSSTLGNSKLYQTSGRIGVGTTAPTVALDVNGRMNVSKSYRIAGADVVTLPGGSANGSITLGYQAGLNMTGYGNTATGASALQANLTGEFNTASGLAALEFNTASNNTAFGSTALFANTIGTQNTGLGVSALGSNNTGSLNTASGASALGNSTTGSNNTAVGAGALLNNNNGNNNIAIGYYSASAVAGVANNNIHIGSVGANGDSATIRIGAFGVQTSFFASGVSGVTTGLNDAVPVLVDSNGQLGTISSSRRFKEDIHDMGEASEGLMHLRPVTFRYQKAFADGSKPLQYGLIAEEVADVYPDLVAHSSDGQIETVKYQLLDSMLLNEMQRQQAKIRSLEERLAKMEAALASHGGGQVRRKLLFEPTAGLRSGAK